MGGVLAELVASRQAVVSFVQCSALGYFPPSNLRLLYLRYPQRDGGGVYNAGEFSFARSILFAQCTGAAIYIAYPGTMRRAVSSRNVMYIICALHMRRVLYQLQPAGQWRLVDELDKMEREGRCVYR